MDLVKQLQAILSALYNVPCVGDEYDQQHSDTHMQAALDLAEIIKRLQGGSTLLDNVVAGLAEFYWQLKYKPFLCRLMVLPIPDTGNAQADYERLRDEVEDFIRADDTYAYASVEDWEQHGPQ